MPARTRLGANLAERSTAVKRLQRETEPLYCGPSMRASGTDLSNLDRSEMLRFIPERPMTAVQLRRLLKEGSSELRAWAMSRLLLYADWEEIWTFVTRDEVREAFATLDLPPAVGAAWARMLGVEEPVAPTR